ncbi:hypothetical protein [Sedimenticola sp.]|uniref:hypothetical protein n=1 Tax=Sedimenticola sp. TaxID=1940285 RepID=UPI003D0DA5A6
MATKRETVDFGDTGTTTLTNELSDAEKQSIASKFPVNVTMDLPFFGEQTFVVREHVKTLLDNLPAPSFEVDFEVDGDCKSIEDTVIEAVSEQMIGTHSGSFQVTNVGVNFTMFARVVARKLRISNCRCEDGSSGKKAVRHFQVKWYIDIDINPGVGGTYPTETQDVYVSTPCCCEKRPAKKKVVKKKVANKKIPVKKKRS